MITIRRAEQRYHQRDRERVVWRTFPPEERAGASGGGFGSLEFLDESRLSPGGTVLRNPRDQAEVVTLVREGALVWQDTAGGSGLIQAGEVRRLSASRGTGQLGRPDANASPLHEAHIFQIRLRPAQTELETSYEQKRFSAAERRGRLCIIASPDGRRESLSLSQDALVFSALLDPGTHVAHELLPGRSVWLHMVLGKATLGELILEGGDGVGITSQAAVSLTAMRETEILLLDLGSELRGLP